MAPLHVLLHLFHGTHPVNLVYKTFCTCFVDSHVTRVHPEHSSGQSSRVNVLP